MSFASNELFEIVNRLEETIAAGKATTFKAPLAALEAAADQAGKAWSGCFIGYHPRVYYRGLRPPPPGAFQP